MQQLFGWILVGMWPQQCFLLDLRPSTEFCGKIHKFLKSFADFRSALVFFVVTTCLLFAWLLALTFSTSISHNFFVFIVLNSNYSATFKSRCSLEPKNFLRGLHSLKPSLRSSECPPDSQVLLMLAAYAFVLIMFTLWVMSDIRSRLCWCRKWDIGFPFCSNN